MRLFDTHFHYEAEDPAPEIYWNALGEFKPEFLMAMGGNFEACRRGKLFAETIPNAFFAIGVHPSDTEEFEGVEKFLGYQSCPKLRAIGELGLDYYYPGASRERQIEVFRAFLTLALEWDLPAVVHLRDLDGKRDAYDDAEQILRPFASRGGRFVVHCYTGPEDALTRFLAMGARIGVTGIVTFPKGDNVRRLLAQIPADRLLLETDSPYLAPVPMRGKRNHPGLLHLVAKAAAEALGVDPEELSAQTTENGRNFFHV
ncbi:MAG: TatD family hydrolase [Victivallaceae bacterium]|nr:TatD family hydrolase [Victivallaceae bacterium]